jgi:hypothetical protein
MEDSAECPASSIEAAPSPVGSESISLRTIESQMNNSRSHSPSSSPIRILLLYCLKVRGPEHNFALSVPEMFFRLVLNALILVFSTLH